MQAYTEGIQDYQTRTQNPLFLEVYVPCATEQAANELRDSFPKSLRLSRGLFWAPQADGTHSMQPAVQLRVNLQSTKGNASNEGGVKRYHRFLELLTKRGYQVTHHMSNTKGAWMTPEELAEVLARY